MENISNDIFSGEDENFLSELSFDVLQDSIREHFTYPEKYKNRDFISLYLNKIALMKDNSLDDDVIMLDDELERFKIFISNLFEESLSIGINVLNEPEYSDDDVFDTILVAYRFFICKIKKNFSNIILNFIEKNKEELISKYDFKTIDVTLSSFKNDNISKEDKILLSQLGHIIDDTFEELVSIDDIDEFFDLCIGNEVSIELESVRGAFDRMELTGNFISKYISMVSDSFKIELQTKVRKTILKRIRKG